ncbi:hypothetical protein ACXDHI_002691 [Klebsiella pneumoniae]
MSNRIPNFGWNRLKLAMFTYEQLAQLEVQVKAEHACKNGIHLFDKAGQRKLDALLGRIQQAEGGACSMTTDITELALIAKIKKQTENFDTVVLKEWEALALVEALEKAQRANAAQDDHINQQQDRIDQLEKGHQEAAKQINSWRRMAKQNIAEREKDIAELDAARQRIAELESRAVTVENLQESAYRAGLTAGWNLGLANNNDGFNKCLAAHAAGIKVEAE